MHPAFKCTYCDGGQGEYVGFAGVCSDDNMSRNVQAGRVQCASGPCRDYCKRGFSGAKPQPPCFEGTLFTEWFASAGLYNCGPKRNLPIPMKRVQKGSIAVFTSRFPDEPREEQRRVVGLFLVGRVGRDSYGSNTLYADPRLRVRFPTAASRRLHFWDYYRNASGEPRWGSGLFRYLRDDQVARLLADAQIVLTNEEDKSVVAEMYEAAFGGSIESAPRPVQRLADAWTPPM